MLSGNGPLLQVDTVLLHKQVLSVIHADDKVRLGLGWVPHSLNLQACSRARTLLNVTVVQTDLPCLHSCLILQQSSLTPASPPGPPPGSTTGPACLILDV